MAPSLSKAWNVNNGIPLHAVPNGTSDAEHQMSTDLDMAPILGEQEDPQEDADMEFLENQLIGDLKTKSHLIVPDEDEILHGVSELTDPYSQFFNPNLNFRLSDTIISALANFVQPLRSNFALQGRAHT